MNELWRLLGLSPQREPKQHDPHQLELIKIGILLGRHTKINPELLLKLSGEGAASAETWLAELGVEVTAGDDIEQIYERLRASLET